MMIRVIINLYLFYRYWGYLYHIVFAWNPMIEMSEMFKEMNTKTCLTTEFKTGNMLKCWPRWNIADCVVRMLGTFKKIDGDQIWKLVAIKYILDSEMKTGLISHLKDKGYI